MDEHKRQIRKLVRLLCSKNTSAIYASDIASQLHYAEEIVEDELQNMVEEEILQHFYELHCCQCGHVMASFEDPRFLRGGCQVECTGCLSQTKATMSDVVNAYKLSIG
jgi:hypothetical protein